MITEEALYATVRAIARQVTNSKPNGDQVAAAVEYAVIPTFSKARDLWAECLTIPAASFVARVREYFATTPRVTTHVTARLMKAVPKCPGARSRSRSRGASITRYFKLLFV